MSKSHSNLKIRDEMDAVICRKLGRMSPQERDNNVFIISLILVFLIVLTFVGYVPVKGSSMMPTIQAEGEAVIAIRYLVNPDYGDIVIINNKDKGLNGVVNDLLIKRVVAKGGDTVSLMPSKEEGKEHEVVLKVNGVVVDEPYVDYMTIYNMDRYQEKIVVPEGHVFVLGDNRSTSADSRTFGTISVSRIESVAVLLIGSGGVRLV